MSESSLTLGFLPLELFRWTVKKDAEAANETQRRKCPMANQSGPTIQISFLSFSFFGHQRREGKPRVSFPVARFFSTFRFFCSSAGGWVAVTRVDDLKAAPTVVVVNVCHTTSSLSHVNCLLWLWQLGLFLRMMAKCFAPYKMNQEYAAGVSMCLACRGNGAPPENKQHQAVEGWEGLEELRSRRGQSERVRERADETGSQRPPGNGNAAS